MIVGSVAVINELVGLRYSTYFIESGVDNTRYKTKSSQLVPLLAFGRLMFLPYAKKKISLCWQTKTQKLQPLFQQKRTDSVL